MMALCKAGLEATSGVVSVLKTFPEEADTPQSAEPPLAPFREAEGGQPEANGSSSYKSITFHVGGESRPLLAHEWTLAVRKAFLIFHRGDQT